MLIIVVVFIGTFILMTILGEGGEGETITVDDGGGADYTRIQDAIDNSRDGDTIRVFEGTYHENVLVDVQVSLIGNGSAHTTIDGGGNGVVVRITVDLVTMGYFSVTGSGDDWRFDTGIFIGSDNNTISNNSCYDNENGIKLEYADHNELTSNFCQDNLRNGIWLNEANYNSILDNQAIYNNDGISLERDCHYNTLSDNNCSSNDWTGIFLSTSDFNTIADNLCQDNRYGMNLSFASNCRISGNIVSNNNLGTRINYAVNNHFDNNSFLDNRGTGLGFNAHSDGNEVENNTFSGTDFGDGLEIMNSDDNVITNNTFSYNEIGVSLELSAERNRLHYNSIFNNTDYGVRAESSGSVVNATYNWWGDPSGPYHPAKNPGGKGDNVTDHVWFDRWLIEPHSDADDDDGDGPDFYVDDDAPEGGNGSLERPFTKIQDAINASFNGSLIQVFDGIYYENLIVNKSIILIGNGSSSTIINGSGKGDVIRINAKFVNISGFTIVNAGDDHYSNAGIHIAANNVEIFDNYFSNNTISDIYIQYRSQVIIEGNEFHGTPRSLWIRDCNYMTISRNNFSSDLNYGDAVIVRSSDSNTFSNNTYFNNGGRGLVIDGNSQFNTVENESFFNNDMGIHIYNSKYNVIRGCNFSGNDVGIHLEDSGNENTIEHCAFSENGIGIHDLASSRNEIINNTFDSNTNSALFISSRWGIISDNTITNNPIGIDVRWCTGNFTVDHNSIFGNSEFGIKVSDDKGYYVDARNNYWGDDSGPYHNTTNPVGKGDNVTDLVDFIPWLTRETEPVVFVNLTGSVRDGDTEQPIEDAQITIYNLGITLGVKTDDLGSYRIMNIPVMETIWIVTVSKEGYLTLVQNPLIPDDLDLDFTLFLRPSDNLRPIVNITSPANNTNQSASFTIHGNAMDPEGSPFFVEYRIGNESWMVIIDGTPEEFDVEILGLVNGTHEIQFRASDGEDFSEIVTLVVHVGREERVSGNGGFWPSPIYLAGGIVLVGFVGIIGLAHVREDVRVGLFSSLIIPFLIRLNRQQMYRDTRGVEVFQFINANPGVNYSRILNSLHITDMRLVNHLDGLLSEGMIKSGNEFGTMKYFPNKDYEHEKKLKSLPPMTLDEQVILESLRKLGPAARCEIENTLPVNPQGINYSIRMLKERELVDCDGEGRWAFCWAVDKPPKRGM